MSPTLAFCERANAAVNKHHLRIVRAEGRLEGGGLGGKTLCDKPLQGGWDIPGEVTPEVLKTVPPGPPSWWVCRTCAEIAQDLLAPAPPNLVWRYPDCGICGEETDGDPDWFWCDNCDATWDKHGEHGAWRADETPEATP